MRANARDDSGCLKIGSKFSLIKELLLRKTTIMPDLISFLSFQRICQGDGLYHIRPHIRKTLENVRVCRVWGNTNSRCEVGTMINRYIFIIKAYLINWWSPGCLEIITQKCVYIYIYIYIILASGICVQMDPISWKESSLQTPTTIINYWCGLRSRYLCLAIGIQNQMRSFFLKKQMPFIRCLIGCWKTISEQTMIPRQFRLSIIIRH